MRFDEIMSLMKQGRRFKRPCMPNAYLTITKVSYGTPVIAEKLVLYINGLPKFDFALAAEHIMATDWVDAQPIIKVKMRADRYVVACPKCGRVYQAGEKWETRVGDVYICTCGNKLLLEPPEEFDNSDSTAEPDKVRTKIVEKLDQWPSA
ncbi:MAG: hypothetical protein PHN69_07135 [Candidatus Pacebacteria bacterium]|nr:hypothetical protein [Candidatus Paceibacterota bacterium]